jgi:hypothetical protein
MPLPDAGTVWPPTPLRRVHEDLTRWSAWWGGDTEALSLAYGGEGHTREHSFRHAGLVRTIHRWFWGQPPRPGEQRAKLHVPLAAEIAQVSADLIFGQPPTITIEGDGAVATQERIDELLGDRSGNQLHEAAEACSALGHTYLRVGWDREVDDEGPLLSTVDADAAFPVYSYDRLREVTFVREWWDAGSVLRHMECHQRGIIWHAAYLGDLNNLGRVVPLSAYPQTADLADQAMIADPDGNGSGIETGLEGLDVVGVKNARSRTWRHLPAARDLGRADISGQEAVLDALDDCWTSWMRDIRHGRSRLHVPMHMLETRGLGKGADFDLDRELYVGLTSPPDGPLSLEATQFAIRFEEHAETARGLIERIVGGAGYSLQTFGLDPSTSTQTATESWARQIRTQNLRNGKLRHWSRAMADLTKILLEVDNAQFNGRNNPSLKVRVQFADTISESQIVRAQTAAMLRTAEAASTKTLVELVHNDWTTEEVDAEVALIQGEKAANTLPDPEQPDPLAPDAVQPPDNGALHGAAPRVPGAPDSARGVSPDDSDPTGT